MDLRLEWLLAVGKMSEFWECAGPRLNAMSEGPSNGYTTPSLEFGFCLWIDQECLMGWEGAVPQDSGQNALLDVLFSQFPKRLQAVSR